MAGALDDQEIGSGASVSRLISAATTNSTLVKGSPGMVVGWVFGSQEVAVRYLKLYNKATAPTVGTDVPRLTLPLPAGASGHVTLAYPIAFETGIGFGLTAGVADNDVTAVTASAIVINVLYL